MAITSGPVNSSNDEHQSQSRTEELRMFALESAGIGVWEWDIRNGRMTFSPAWAAMLGYRPEDLRGHFDTWKRLLHPDDATAAMERLQMLVRGDAPSCTSEHRVLCSNGEYLWVRVHGAVIARTEKGEAWRVGGSQLDISERKQAESDLARERALRDTLFRHAPIGFAVFRLDDGESMFVSAKFETVYGLPAGSLRNLHDFYDRVFPDPEPGDPSGMQGDDVHLSMPDGTGRIVSGSAFPLPDSNMLIIAAQDVTAQRRAEDQVRKLSSALEQSPASVVITSIDGSIEYVNEHFVTLTGYSRDEVIGRNPRILKSGHTPPEDYAQLWRSVLGGSEWRGEFRNRKKNGELYWEEAVISPLIDSGGKIASLIAVKENITERKTMEEALRESETRFRTLAQHAPVGIFLTDAQGDAVFVNEYLCRLAGLSAEQAAGRGWMRALHPDERDQVFAAWEQAFRTSGPLAVEQRIVAPGGRTVWVAIHAVPLKRADGELTGYVGTAADITERRTFEHHILAAKDQAEQGNRLKSAILANLSHEFRTPLNGVIGLASILKRDLLNPEQIQTVDQIAAAGTRLTATLNSLVLLSEIQSNLVTPRPIEVNLADAASAMAGPFAAKARSKGLEFRLEMNDRRIAAVLDPHLLEEAVRHLLDNAVKFTRQGFVALEISSLSRQEELWATLRVADSGIGIAARDHDAVFEPFRQASDGYARGYEGVGLGLTIAKRLAELMGGSISLESEPDSGSTFTLRFPGVRSRPALIPAPPAWTGERATSPGRHTGSVPRVLLVEDNGVNASVVAQYLKGVCTVDVAREGDTALRMAEQERYDLLLMDIHLGPGMDGIQITQRLRSMERYATTPIVAVTGYAMAGDRERLMSSGFTHYLGKPFAGDDIVPLVREILAA